MVSYTAPLYQNLPVVLNEKQCAKAAKHKHRDGYGTKHWRKGYIGSFQFFGDIRYNGGCCRPVDAPEADQEWFQGENFPLPIVADGYEIVEVSSWGYYIQLKGTK